MLLPGARRGEHRYAWARRKPGRVHHGRHGRRQWVQPGGVPACARRWLPLRCRRPAVRPSWPAALRGCADRSSQPFRPRARQRWVSSR
jgi:hypothetical protein